MERNIQRMTLCQGRVPAQPAWMPEFLMEHQQGPARATFDDRELGTCDVHQTLSPCLCVACHRRDNLLVVCDCAVCPRFVSQSIPTVSLLLTPVASRNLLLLQSLPDSIPYRPANVRRRKDEHCVGAAARGLGERLSRLPRRVPSVVLHR